MNTEINREAEAPQRVACTDGLGMVCDICGRHIPGTKHPNKAGTEVVCFACLLTRPTPPPEKKTICLPAAKCGKCGSTNLEDTGSFLVEMHKCKDCGELYCQDSADAGWNA